MAPTFRNHLGGKRLLSFALAVLALPLLASGSEARDPFPKLDPVGVSLSSSGSGEARWQNGKLQISAAGRDSTWAVLSTETWGGNFFAEIEFPQDDAVGLALIAEKDGKPDLDNYTLFSVSRRDGVVVVEQQDRQQGRANVHDPRGKISADRYRATLDGKTFSIPFTGTNGKLRILRESLSNTFHFYYGTRLERWGVTSNDWLEVAPQYSWLPAEQKYFVGLLCRTDHTAQKSAEYHALRIVNTPTDDLDDRQTGFKVTQREFSWSGFSGDATIVTFGEDFAFDRNLKFVLWDRANNAPAWRLTNQFLLNFEFFEGGDAVHPGCHEAMSDRQRHGQIITVEEDNAVRKVIRWKGVPVNPNYHYTGDGDPGTELPTYEEIWTLYPDGAGTRQLIHQPKSDGPRKMQWGPEFIEFMPIGGSLVEAGDLCASPALTIADLGSRQSSFHPPAPKGNFDESTWGWDQLIFAAHFLEGVPDFYMAYNQADDIRDTWSGLKLQGQLSWHKTGHRFSHWPVGREPYGQNTNAWGATSRSYASHVNEVTHTSLVSAGFYERGVDWADNWERDPVTGRPQRRHVMAVGLAKPHDIGAMRAAVAAWLRPGSITPIDDSCQFERIDRLQRAVVLKPTGPKADIRFTVSPGSHPWPTPTFQVTPWSGGDVVKVEIDNRPATARVAKVGNSLLVWCKETVSSTATVRIVAGDVHK